MKCPVWKQPRIGKVTEGTSNSRAPFLLHGFMRMQYDCNIILLLFQQLEEEKDALKITAELLQVRLTSLSDILMLQEMELSKKVDTFEDSGYDSEE